VSEYQILEMVTVQVEAGACNLFQRKIRHKINIGLKRPPE